MKKVAVFFVALVLVSALVSADIDDDDLDEESTVIEDDQPQAVLEQQKLNQKVEYVAPKPKGNSYFHEHFGSSSVLGKRWILSTAKKEDIDENIAKYDGIWSVEQPSDNPLQGDDLGIVLKTKAKHHAVAAKLDKPFDFSGKPLIVQYEVKFQNGQECGGAYVKLLSQEKDFDLRKFHDKTPYTIMFGPDKCGNDNKLHFIFRHKNPKTGVYEEKHAKKPTAGLDTFFSDKRTHLFTLIINTDNTFELFVDQDLVNSGSLLSDVNPAVNPPKEVVDPNDKKPDDWDEREKVPDPTATKPEDWDEDEKEMIEDVAATKPEGWLDDEPELITDPDGEKPADWDNELDGEWEAPKISNPKCESAPGCGEWNRPTIKNPKYKGKWKAPLISNPNYKGKWTPKMIANPDYFEDTHPYKMTPIGAIGLELWSMSDNILFDNFIITDSKTVADLYAADSWELKRSHEMSATGSGKSVVQAVMDATQERPWLWAVFIVVVVLPIVLVIAYCCCTGSTPRTEDVARHKKTDEQTPDDVDDEGAKEEVSPETSEPSQAAGDPPVVDSPKASSKSSLNSTQGTSESPETSDDSTVNSPNKSPARKRKGVRKD